MEAEPRARVKPDKSGVFMDVAELRSRRMERQTELKWG
jgi:hypothetical protein